jgi:hypothetical protein
MKFITCNSSPSDIEIPSVVLTYHEAKVINASLRKEFINAGENEEFYRIISRIASFVAEFSIDNNPI